MILMLQPCASLPIVTVRGGCLPQAPQEGWPGVTPRVTPAGSKRYCPRSPSLPLGPAILCCTACVLSAWFGVTLSLCLFLPCHPWTGLSTLPLPPFLHPPVSPGPSRAVVNVYIVFVALGVCVPPPHPACTPTASRLAHRRDQAPLPLGHSSCRRGHLYIIFHSGPKLGGSGALSPSSSLPPV